MSTLSELTAGVFRDDAIAVGSAATITPSTHPHSRARIRSWIVARLRAGALLPDRIQATQITPTSLAVLPKVFVYTISESDAEDFSSDYPATINRPLTVAVHFAVTNEGLNGVPLDDAIDAIAHVAERLLLLDSDRAPDGQLLFFGGEATLCDLGSTSIAVDEKAQRPVIHARIDFRVRYQSELTDPDPAPVLAVVHAEWDLAPPDGTLEAEDEVQIPQ